METSSLRRFTAGGVFTSRAARRSISGALIALSAAGLFAACSKDDDPTNPATRTIAVVSGDAQNGVVGTALTDPIVVQVKDPSGNPLSNVAVTWTIDAAMGTLANQSATTDAEGKATANWTLGTTSGAQSFTVTAAGVSAPITVTATAAAGEAADVTVSDGDTQTGGVGTALANPLIVKVVDAHGNGVPGVTVTWTTSSNGTFATPTSVTNDGGLAQNTYTLGTTPGTETVTATITVGATTKSITFTLTST
jgi:hypothetical protein